MVKKESRGIGSSYVSELTKLRINSGLSLTEVEELTGIRYNTMSNWESGKVKTPRVTDPKTQSGIILLCELYDITVSQFEYFMNDAYCHAHKEEFMSKYQTGFRKLRTKNNVTRNDIQKALCWPEYRVGLLDTGSLEKVTDKEFDMLSLLLNTPVNDIADILTADYTGPAKTTSNKKVTKRTKAKTIKLTKEKPIVTPKIEDKQTSEDKYKGLLDRIYGQIDYNDFILIQKLVNNRRN